MPKSKKILLVEGEIDKSFFEAICRKLALNTTVQVAPPRDLGGTYNSKGGVLERLAILLPQLADGQITNIAAIIDADYIIHGSGNQQTVEKISEIIAPFDFKIKRHLHRQNGLCFENSDGLADFGLWVMPDNRQEGVFEDWVKSCIKDDEKALFQQANKAVQKLSEPKFKPHLQIKAEIATWLAWQKTPGHGLRCVLKDELLDENHLIFQGLCQWLKSIFE